MQTHKQCNSCRRMLLVEYFSPRKAYNSFRSVCRNCDREDSRKRYADGVLGKRGAGNVKPAPHYKVRARELAQYAVRIGKLLKRPCRVCGNNAVQGHHPDYSKPLEVLWFCRPHHMELHRKPDEAIARMEP